MTVISGFDERVILTRRATVWIPHLANLPVASGVWYLLGRKGRWPSQGGVTFSSAWTSPRIEMATAGVLRSSVMVPRLHRAAFVWRRRERARAPPLASAPRPRRVGSTAGDETSSAPLRLHPPPATPLPPRVEHVILGPDTSGPAASVLARLIPGEPRVDETTVRQLIAFGAVYHAETPPPRVLNGYPRHLRPRRVRDPDLLLTPGAYCRVHVHPKRFPAAAAVDWRARLIASSEDFVAVDKPPGVNVSMTVDNAVECVAQCVAAEMRADNPPTTIADASSSSDAEPPSWAESDPLVVTHRLDAATSGVLVLARTVDFARRFNDALRAKRVRKLYACLTLAPVPTGLMEHWTEETSEGPRRHIARELLPGDATWSPPPTPTPTPTNARFCTRTDENDACFECSGANRSTRARCRRRFWRRLGIRSRVLSPGRRRHTSRGWSS